MDWITENIAIGNYLDAREPNSSVSAVLCLKPDCCDPLDSDRDVEHIPLIDGPGNTDADIRNALDFLQDLVSADEKVLVHCHAGRSRSVVIVARFLMSQGYTRDGALQRISSKRDIYLSDGIDDVLSRRLNN